MKKKLKSLITKRNVYKEIIFLIAFESESKKASFKYFSLFNKTIDVTHECK